MRRISLNSQQTSTLLLSTGSFELATLCSVKVDEQSVGIPLSAPRHQNHISKLIPFHSTGTGNHLRLTINLGISVWRANFELVTLSA
jgi:hypothetical protein